MKPQDKKIFTSKQLLEKIGITEGMPDTPLDMLDEENDLEGDLAPLLRERYHQLKEVLHELRPGMVISWKPGLKNRRWPAYGKPAIVVEILDTPLYDLDEPGSTYFHETLDMIIGVFVDSGEHRGQFLIFHSCSERYQPWSEKEVAA